MDLQQDGEQQHWSLKYAHPADAPVEAEMSSLGLLVSPSLLFRVKYGAE